MSNPVKPLNPKQTAAQEAKAASENYFERILATEDQQINADLDGLPDETMSARFGRWAKNYHGVRGFIGRFMCRALNLAQANHDVKAVAGDAARARRVLETEEESGLIDDAR